MIACNFFCPRNIQSGVKSRCGVLFQKLSLCTPLIRAENKRIDDVFVWTRGFEFSSHMNQPSRQALALRFRRRYLASLKLLFADR